VPVVCLGAFAWDAALRLRTALGRPPARPKPKFGHGALWYDDEPGGWALLGTYHPSQQNTFTGVLTEDMLDDVLRTAREVAGAD
jgi:uracil-DNA glycosylase